MNQTGSFITSVAAVKAASTCKLLQFLPDRRIVYVIMELGGNCSFTLSIGNNKGSGLPQLKNSNPQGCVMAPLLFNIYIWDLANTTYTKYTYTNNPTIMHANGDWQTVEGCLAMTWHPPVNTSRPGKLNLSTTKAVLAVFHRNMEAKSELKVNHNNETMPFCSEPTYLGVMLDMALTCCQHLMSPHKKLISCIVLLRQLAGYDCSNVANSHLCHGPYNSRVLRSWLVPQCSHLPHWPCHQWRFANCDCMPASYTSGQHFPSLQASNQLSFVAEPHCL